jgi:hypothetical protein
MVLERGHAAGTLSTRAHEHGVTDQVLRSMTEAVTAVIKVR